MALETWGRIDVLVHNAGFTLGSMPFERETTPVSTSCSRSTRARIRPGPGSPAAMQSRYGRIVIAASSALYGMAASIPYSTAKASFPSPERSPPKAPPGHQGEHHRAASRDADADNMQESDFRTWFLKTMRTGWSRLYLGVRPYFLGERGLQARRYRLKTAQTNSSARLVRALRRSGINVIGHFGRPTRLSTNDHDRM